MSFSKILFINTKYMYFCMATFKTYHVCVCVCVYDKNINDNKYIYIVLNMFFSLFLEESNMEEQIPHPKTENSGSLVKLLEDRLKMYETAENNAKTAGESGRARRFNRGIKTLKDLLKQANAGKLINDEDIPPKVTVNNQKSNIYEPSELTTEQATAKLEIPETDGNKSVNESEENVELSEKNVALLKILNTRRDEYKLAALKAKKSDDSALAISYIKVAKQFEGVIKALENGQTVDLSKMPGPPSEAMEVSFPKKEENQSQGHSDKVPEEVSKDEEVISEEALIKAESVAEALLQRLEVYKAQETIAKDQGNPSKARRMGRIVKQFEQAIKLHNAGKPVPFDELPTPPGYAPFSDVEQLKNAHEEVVQIQPVKPSRIGEDENPSLRPAPPVKTNSIRYSGNHLPNTRSEKQMALLLARQKEFKEAALAAKRKGEITQAKEYLRNAKGFDPLIKATMGGMPVDINSLPLPPSAKTKLDME